MTLHIPLDAARAGMILGAAVEDANGNTLLPHGGMLTDALLASLRRRGIQQVQIDNSLANEDTATPEMPTQQAITTRIDFIFRHTSGKASRQLRAAILAHALREAR